MQRFYESGPIALTAQDIKERTDAIEGLAAVSQAGGEKIRAAKTELIDKLEGEQARLIRLEIQEAAQYRAMPSEKSANGWIARLPPPASLWPLPRSR